LGKAGLYEV
jgi:DNA topoisomerase III